MRKHLEGVSSVKGRAPNKDEKEQIEIAQKVLACLEGEQDVRWGLRTPPVAAAGARLFSCLFGSRFVPHMTSFLNMTSSVWCLLSPPALCLSPLSEHNLQSSVGNLWWKPKQSMSSRSRAGILAHTAAV